MSLVCDVFRRKIVSDEDDDLNVMLLYASLSVVHFDVDTLSHVLPNDVWLTLRYAEYGIQLSCVAYVLELLVELYILV